MLQPWIGHGHHAHVRLNGGERVIGGQDLVVGQGVEEGGLAHVGEPDNADGKAHEAGRLAREKAGICRQCLEVGLGTGTRVRNHLGGAERAEPGAVDRPHTVRQAEEEPRSKQIPGAGGVDHPLDRGRRDLLGAPCG